MDNQEMQFADPEWPPPAKPGAMQSSPPQPVNQPVEEEQATIISPDQYDKLPSEQETRRVRQPREGRRIGRRAFAAGLLVVGVGTLGGLLWWVERRPTSIVSAPHPGATTKTGPGLKKPGYPPTVTASGPIRTVTIPANLSTVIVQCDGAVTITGSLLMEVDAHAFYDRKSIGAEEFSDHIRFSLNKPGNELTVTVDPPAQNDGKIYLNLTMPEYALLTVQAQDDITVQNIVRTEVSLTSVTGGITFAGSLTGTCNIHSAQGIQYLGPISEIGTYYFQSDQGNVELLLPDGTIFELQAKTGGTLTNDFQNENTEAFPRCRLFITANHGDIVIKKSF